MKYDCPVLNVTGRKSVESPHKYYFEETFPLQVLSMECAKCIPWVCETFSVACQVTAPPLGFHAYLQKYEVFFCRHGYFQKELFAVINQSIDTMAVSLMICFKMTCRDFSANLSILIFSSS